MTSLLLPWRRDPWRSTCALGDAGVLVEQLDGRQAPWAWSVALPWGACLTGSHRRRLLAEGQGWAVVRELARGWSPSCDLAPAAGVRP